MSARRLFGWTALATSAHSPSAPPVRALGDLATQNTAPTQNAASAPTFISPEVTVFPPAIPALAVTPSRPIT